MNSGTCIGGPLDGQQLHHKGFAYQLAINPYPTRPGPTSIPGMIASADLDIRFGTYYFASGTWTWNESAQSAGQNPVDNENG